TASVQDVVESLLEQFCRLWDSSFHDSELLLIEVLGSDLGEERSEGGVEFRRLYDHRVAGSERLDQRGRADEGRIPRRDDEDDSEGFRDEMKLVRCGIVHGILRGHELSRLDPLVHVLQGELDLTECHVHVGHHRRVLANVSEYSIVDCLLVLDEEFPECFDSFLPSSQIESRSRVVEFALLLDKIGVGNHC
ncbi:hypothetical protein PENTCL1PPCAC_29601, partial [Pristionchus entomophagus]